jgi:predicted nucleotidyltransferase
MWRKALISILFSAALLSLHAQVFELVKTDMKGVMEPLAAWISPGDKLPPEFYLSGEYYAHDRQMLVSQMGKIQNKTKFVSLKSPFPDLYQGASAVADFDKDGDDDIILTGINQENALFIRLFRQDDDRFTPINQLFTPVTDGSIEWGDFDHDGDLDLLITGKEFNNNLSTKIYRNDNGIYTDINLEIPGVYHGNATWGDMDNDHDLDILITGNTGSKPFTAIYRNDNGKYVRLASQLIDLKNSAAVWGDLDNDGDLDILISGEDENGMPVCFGYRNESNTYFRQMPVSLRPLKSCTIDLGDYDHDGDLDVVMTGESLERSYTLVYQNNSGFNFEQVISPIPGVSSGTALWGDFDLDGDLDLLVAGLTICYDFVGQIYRNNLNPTIADDTENLFIEAPIPQTNNGPFYYYVFSSCYCDPTGGDHIAYHLYVSNVHLMGKKYELNYKFNDLLIKDAPNWGDVDRGFRTSNGHVTKAEAEAARKQLIESYKETHFQVHYLNW